MAESKSVVLELAARHPELVAEIERIVKNELSSRSCEHVAKP